VGAFWSLLDHVGEFGNIPGAIWIWSEFINPSGCCRPRLVILPFPWKEHPCFGWLLFLYAPRQLADRAFGAQRSSGGRSGRRFAPPSAFGGGHRFELLWGAFGANKKLTRTPANMGLRDWAPGLEMESGG